MKLMETFNEPQWHTKICPFFEGLALFWTQIYGLFAGMYFGVLIMSL